MTRLEKECFSFIYSKAIDKDISLLCLLFESSRLELGESRDDA